MSKKLVTVARFAYLHRAYLIKGWLDSAGIENCIVNHGLSYVISTQAENQIEIQVYEEDVENALSIIDNLSEKYGPEFQEPDQMISSIRNILVPVDFSENSLNAARYALHVAQQKNAKITLVHAYFNPVTNPLCYDNFYTFPSNVADALREIEETAHLKMQEILVKLKYYMDDKSISGIVPDIKLIGGIAEEAVLELAQAGSYDLIVLGSKGKSISDYWFGSFALNIMEKAKVPVLAIPEEARYKDTGFKKLMYATDFDKSDGMAIRKLLNIARPLDVRIYVVHIDVSSENPFINYDLEHFKDKYIGQIENIDMNFDLIQNPNLIKGIENYILDKQIDILSVTTHKRNLITALIKPSIAKELLFEIKIPLLVFHSPGN